GARSPARSHAPLRGRLHPRTPGRPAAPSRPELPVPRRGAEGRARALLARAPPPNRSGLARPLPLLHRVYATDAPALPRPRGGDRRRRAPTAEPLLGRGAGTVPAGRGRALDDAAGP